MPPASERPPGPGGEPPPPAEGAGAAAGSGALDERPPFLTWPKIYLLVLGALAAQVVAYAVLTKVLQ